MRIIAKHYGYAEKKVHKKKKIQLYILICFLGKMMNIFSERPMIRPQFCWQTLLGSHQIKSGRYKTSNIHAFCDTAGRIHVAWYMVKLYMWPPCQWSEIGFSGPRCFLLLNSISSTPAVFTGQPTGSLMCWVEQACFFHLFKMPSSDKRVFSPNLEKISHSLQRLSQLWGCGLTSLPHTTRAGGDSADLLQRCWPVRSPKLQMDCSLALPLQPAHPSCHGGLVFKLENSELVSTAPETGAWCYPSQVFAWKNSATLSHNLVHCLLLEHGGILANPHGGRRF